MKITLAFFCVGISVFEEKSVGISVLEMPCGDGKKGFFGRYFGDSSNTVGEFSKNLKIKAFESALHILNY